MASHDYVEVDELDWEDVAGDEQALDWKARPHEVLSAVARQLKPLGFEVLVRRMIGDSYHWKIRRVVSQSSSGGGDGSSG